MFKVTTIQLFHLRSLFCGKMQVKGKKKMEQNPTKTAQEWPEEHDDPEPFQVKGLFF